MRSVPNPYRDSKDFSCLTSLVFGLSPALGVSHGFSAGTVGGPAGLFDVRGVDMVVLVGDPGTSLGLVTGQAQPGACNPSHTGRYGGSLTGVAPAD